jgi:hypothetical protein
LIISVLGIGGTRLCADVPPLGKDSLGVWLSNWGWNSGIGKERWQEGFVMDLGRGSLLAQPWSDHGSLAPEERRQLADFIRLLKQRTDCFLNTRSVFGDPWKNEPYGYCCSNGQRAFFSLNNCTWSDAALILELGPASGLPEGRHWDVYRWYPHPAKLSGVRGGRSQFPRGENGTVSMAAREGGSFEKTAIINLRPFAVGLLEAVPVGERPSLDRPFERASASSAFAEPSRTVELAVSEGPAAKAAEVPREIGPNRADRASLPPKKVLEVKCEIPPSKNGGMLVIIAQMRRGEMDAPRGDNGSYFAASAKIAGQEAPCETIVPRSSFDAPWQGWRIPFGPSATSRPAESLITAMIPAEITLTCRGYFLPR